HVPRWPQLSPRGRNPGADGQRAPAGSHQRRPPEGGRARGVSARSVLSAQRHADRGAAAARAPRGDPPACAHAGQHTGAPFQRPPSRSAGATGAARARSLRLARQRPRAPQCSRARDHPFAGCGHRARAPGARDPRGRSGLDLGTARRCGAGPHSARARGGARQPHAGGGRARHQPLDAEAQAGRIRGHGRGGRGAVKARLGLMMFLEYAIWGAWAPVLWPYLTDTLGLGQSQAGWIFSLLWLACLLAPLTGGQVADRWLPTQSFLGIAHLVGGAILLVLGRRTGAGPGAFGPWLGLMGAYSLVFAPTLALTNSIVFQHLSEADFGRIRVFGTIGWIASGLILSGWRRGLVPSPAG